MSSLWKLVYNISKKKKKISENCRRKKICIIIIIIVKNPRDMTECRVEIFCNLIIPNTETMKSVFGCALSKSEWIEPVGKRIK